MPREQSPEPDKNELSSRDIERVMRIALEPGTSLGDFLNNVRQKKAIGFVIDKKNFKVFLSVHMHDKLLKNTGMKQGRSLVDSAFFLVDPQKGTVKFDYLANQDLKSVKNIQHAIRVCDVAQAKIKEFLNTNGVEVR